MDWGETKETTHGQMVVVESISIVRMKYKLPDWVVAFSRWPKKEKKR